MRSSDFDQLFVQHAAPLLRFLVYRIGGREEAEDVLSETFERALRSPGFDPRRHDGRAWLYTTALNLVRDRARRGAVEERVLAGVHGEQVLEDAAARVAIRQTVMEALAVLSAEEREAVALRFGADLTVPEMAVLLDQPLTTMEGRLYRALRKLRGALGER
jgi:RNA polymerase sigma-70 factor (ECF subfamily)